MLNQYYPPTLEKDYNIMIEGRHFFDQPVKNDLKKCDNIRKAATGQDDGCTTECLINYSYFNKYYKLMAIGLSKQQKLDVDPRKFQILQKEQLRYYDFISS